MCLIVFAYQVHPDYPLVLVANRDEFYERPTAAAHYWPDHPDLFAGRDEEQGGSWLGINTAIADNPRLAAVTNFREAFNEALFNEAVDDFCSDNPDTYTSRGELIRRYLANNDSAANYLQQLAGQHNHFQGFNLLLWDQQQLFYSSNRVAAGNTIQTLQPGIYALSNGLLDAPWPKAQRAKQQLQAALASAFGAEKLLEVLSSRDEAPDEQLPDTGVGMDIERMLSPCFIHTEGYGTRSTSVVLMHNDHTVEFLEQSWDAQGNPGQQRYLHSPAV